VEDLEKVAVMSWLPEGADHDEVSTLVAPPTWVLGEVGGRKTQRSRVLEKSMKRRAAWEESIHGMT
jgi:hypothetical protein